MMKVAHTRISAYSSDSYLYHDFTDNCIAIFTQIIPISAEKLLPSMFKNIFDY